MSSSRKSHRSKKSKKLPNKSQSSTSNAKQQKPPRKSQPPASNANRQKPEVSIDCDDEPRNRSTIPFYFRPASLKFRKKHTSAFDRAANHRRWKSLPSIPIADEIYEAFPRGRLAKLTTLYDLKDVEVIDCRHDDNSEDELLQLWYEESRLQAPAYHSDDETKPRMKPFAFADTGGDKFWLNETIAEPYASDTILRDQLTRPYFDAEYESLKRQHWIEMSHERATRLPINRQIIFKVLTKNRPRNVLTHLRLGYCVTYAGPCPFGQICQNRCSACGICRHQYHCSCRKNKRFGWCWHMHAAVLTVKCAFTEELTVYVANSSRLMQLAHIRASCYDSQQNVNQVEENLFHVYENWSEQPDCMYLVRRLAAEPGCLCPLYKSCPECHICGHMYSCSCVEYENGNLCEHCHLVAMYLSKSLQGDETGEFYYPSDCSDDMAEEDERIPGEEAVLSERMRRVLMIHERSNSVSSKRIEAFLEPPDNQLCFTAYQSSSEEPWFIEDCGLFKCDCAHLPDAVICPSCRVCSHEMKCYCSPPDGYCCKHLHAIKRFLKVQYNVQMDKRFGDEKKNKDLDGLLLKARQEREIKRQKCRNRFYQIQDIPLMRKGRKNGATEKVTSNQFTPLELVLSLESVPQCHSTPSKIALQNEACLVEKSSKNDEKESISLADSSEHVTGNAEIQLLAPASVDEKTVGSSSESKIQNTETAEDPIVSYSSSNVTEEVLSKKIPLKRTAEEKNKLESNAPLSAESTYSTHNNPDFTDFSVASSEQNKEFKFSSAPEPGEPLDHAATFKHEDSKEILPQTNVPDLQASQKSSRASSNEAGFGEKLAGEKVTLKFDDLDQTIQHSSKSTDKPKDDICKEETIQQNVCEDGLSVVMVEQTGIESQDTKLESEIDSRTIKVCSNRADVSTQTDPVDRITVSTQTSDIDFTDKTTSDSGTATENKKRRKTKTRRKQLKQSVNSGSLAQTSNEDSAQNEICTLPSLPGSSSTEISENNANERKESNLKA